MPDERAGRPVGLWVVGALCVGVVVVALWLANRPPTLTYSASDLGAEGDIAVSCERNTDVADQILLESPSIVQKNFVVVDGKTALADVMADSAAVAEAREPEPKGVAITAGINGDCAQATVSRQWTVIWILVTLVPLGVAFALLAVARMLPAKPLPGLISRLAADRTEDDTSRR